MRKLTISTLLAVVTVSIIALAATSSAHAQCLGVTITNNTGCNLALCFYDAGGNRSCANLPAVGGPVHHNFPPGFVPVGALDANKNQHQFDPMTGCTICILLPGSFVVQGCCAVVCYDPTACTVTVTSCPGQC